MANYSIKADLLKLKGAFLTNLKGKTATKRCLIIPVDDAGLFVGEKGIYLNMTGVEMREPKYGDSHCVKINLDREVYNAMSEEERKAIPILGGMHEIEQTVRTMRVNGTLDAATSFAADPAAGGDNPDDDLPF